MAALGWLLNLGFAGSETEAIAGPWEVVAADSYSAGARAAGAYHPGAVEADNYQAGAVAADAEPM